MISTTRLLRSESIDEFNPEFHYDNVLPAWRLLMGRNLHYGFFQTANEELDDATHTMTLRMSKHARLRPGLDVLDVGCGDGQNSSALAELYGCRITGISTGADGVERARRLARDRGLTQRVKFEVRDGMDNQFPDQAFDCAWVLQSSHFMLDKRRLFQECVRVLRPGGRVVIGDIMLRSPLPMIEIVKRREEFLLLHQVFGRAKMEPLSVYRALAEEAGLQVDVVEDVSAETLPTFERWRRNAMTNKDDIVALVGEALWQKFRDSCDVLEDLWKQELFGYGIVAGTRL
jgi:27-O-demethylrifamycin SV methyltransferase